MDYACGKTEARRKPHFDVRTDIKKDSRVILGASQRVPARRNLYGIRTGEIVRMCGPAKLLKSRPLAEPLCNVSTRGAGRHMDAPSPASPVPARRNRQRRFEGRRVGLADVLLADLRQRQAGEFRQTFLLGGRATGRNGGEVP